MKVKFDNKILQAGLGYTIGNYLIKGLAFLTVPLFSRLMSTSDYGIYNTFVASEGIIYVLIGFALHTSYKSAWYKFVDEKNSRNEFDLYVSDTFAFIILNTIVWLFICDLFSDYITDFLSLNRLQLNLLVMYSAATAILACYNAYIGIDYRYKKFIVISSVNAVANIILSIIFMYTVMSENRATGRMMGTTLPVVFISSLIICSFFKKELPKSGKKYLKWGLKYSIPIVPNGIGQVILGQFDRIMIHKMVGASSAGVYSFAYNVFGLVNVTAMSLDNVWGPWLFRKMRDKDYESIKRKSRIYLIIMALFSAIIILISPELVKLLGDVEYWNASYCVIPIIAGGYFNFMCSLPISVEYFYEKTKIIATGTIIAAIINIILNFFFIKEFGYIAAAYTTLVTYIIYFFSHYTITKYIHGNYLFSNKTICQCSFGILFVNIISLIAIKTVTVRWFLAFLLALVLFVEEEREIGMIRKMFGGHNNENID